MTTPTKTKKQAKLLTTGEWSELMHKHHGVGSGLMALEQAMFQSEHNKVCIECLGTENLVHQDKRLLIQSTSYYMCQECIDYYEKKG